MFLLQTMALMFHYPPFQVLLDETTRSTTPLDIVLVLDRSGSMAHNFAGGSFTSDSNPSRMTGLKTAVSNFVKEAKTRNDQITDSSKKSESELCHTLLNQR